MKLLQNPRLYLVVFILGLIRLTMVYYTQKRIIVKQELTIDSLTNKVDSLGSELFIERNYSGRYELGLEYLKEIDSTTFKKVDHYISHETE